ncbi:hypothetical protein SynSYN20_00477 [Synechococcus sp. SYN20]|nr:hypothetical protein SynSYN20_00477 [Synechococcus sp. SYN20]
MINEPFLRDFTRPVSLAGFLCESIIQRDKHLKNPQAQEQLRPRALFGLMYVCW